VAKLSFRDIMGYCMVYFIIYTIVVSIAFLLLPAFFAIS
jgi:short subunit fatty acids transporter